MKSTVLVVVLALSLMHGAKGGPEGPKGGNGGPSNGGHGNITTPCVAPEPCPSN